MNVEADEKLQRTIARIDIDKKSKEGGQTVLDFAQEERERMSEEGLDIPFLVRQLLDVVPNPWQGMRILKETLESLRSRGVSEGRIYANRLDLLQVMKQDLRKQVSEASETLFRNKLKSGEISLRLVSSNDPELNWRLAETLEMDVLGTDPLLRKKNGEPLERNLFEEVYLKEFNELE